MKDTALSFILLPYHHWKSTICPLSQAANEQKNNNLNYTKQADKVVVVKPKKWPSSPTESCQNRW